MVISIRKIKALALAVVLALSVFAFTACSPKAEARSKYVITAEYDAEKQQVDALLTLEYVNNYDVELSEVKFHLYPRAFREGAKFAPVGTLYRYEAYPSGISYGDMSVFKVTRDGKEQSISIGGQDEDILTVSGSLKPTQKTTIEIDFRVVLPEARHRFGHFDGIANLGNWYPIACVYSGGEFDTTPYYDIGDPFYSECADYEVTITTPTNMVTATSGSQTVKTENGKRVITSKIQNARDFAVVIGDFNVVSNQKNGVTVNYYYKNDDKPADSVRTAFDALSTFGELFGDYAYDTLSVVKNPFCYGGMEYPGLVYISDKCSPQSHTEVIVHEIAHQWWYAAVGNNQILEPWMDEGLAEYSTTWFYEKNPSYGVKKDDRLADTMTSYLVYCENAKPTGVEDTSMNRRTCDYSGSTEYTAMIYVKGQMLFDSVCTAIGRKAFFTGLKNYYAAYKYKIATGKDLVGFLEAAAATNLSSFVDSWLTGKVKMFAE